MGSDFECFSLSFTSIHQTELILRFHLGEGETVNKMFPFCSTVEPVPNTNTNGVVWAHAIIMVYSYPEWRLYENKIPRPTISKKNMMGIRNFYMVPNLSHGTSYDELRRFSHQLSYVSQHTNGIHHQVFSFAMFINSFALTYTVHLVEHIKLERPPSETYNK